MWDGVAKSPYLATSALGSWELGHPVGREGDEPGRESVRTFACAAGAVRRVLTSV